jgi:hypothetical protein
LEGGTKVPNYSPLTVFAWVTPNTAFPEELAQRLKRVVNIDISATQIFGPTPIVVEESSFHAFCRQCTREQHFPEPAFLLADPILRENGYGVALREGLWKYFNGVFQLPWHAYAIGDQQTIEQAEKEDYPMLRRVLEAK